MADTMQTLIERRAEELAGEQFYVVSIKHTKPNRGRFSDRYISFWRPNDCGYCWPLSWAGRYSAESVAKQPDYYNDGEGTIAVPVGIVEALGTPPIPGYIDGNAGPVVPNTAANWRLLRAARATTGKKE